VGTPSGTSENDLVAGEDVDPECENGVSAEAACSGAWSDGAAPAQSAAQSRANPSQKFIVHASMYGKVCLRHGRRLHRASARHNESVFRFGDRDGLDGRGDSKIHHGKDCGDRPQSRDDGWIS
jgi:hypothetical protein